MTVKILSSTPPLSHQPDLFDVCHVGLITRRHAAPEECKMSGCQKKKKKRVSVTGWELLIIIKSLIFIFIASSQVEGSHGYSIVLETFHFVCVCVISLASYLWRAWLIRRVSMTLTTGRSSVGLTEEDNCDPRLGSWGEAQSCDRKQRAREEAKQECQW